MSSAAAAAASASKTFRRWLSLTLRSGFQSSLERKLGRNTQIQICA